MPVDGEIDYGTCSREQLEEALTRIDRDAFPLNLARLTRELERRRAEDAFPRASAPREFPADFGRSGTRDAHNSFGWNGPGTIRVESERLHVAAERKPFLRRPSPCEATFALAEVANVEQCNAVVRLEVHDGAAVRHFQAWLESEGAARELAELLPPRRTAAFAPVLADASRFAELLEQRGVRPVVVPILVALNALVFVVVAASGGGWFVPEPEVLVEFGSNYTPYTSHGEAWRLATCTFLHFGFLHLALNMWALWAQGPLVEKLYGSLRFAIVYLAAGVCGSLASFAWHPLVNSAGASGAIFGVYGALLAYLLRFRHAIPATVVAKNRNGIAIFVVVSLLNGVQIPGIDNAAHLGGLVAGFLVGALFAEPPSVQRGTSRSIGAFAGASLLAAVFLVTGIAATQSRAARERTDAAVAAVTGRSATKVAQVTAFWGVRIGMTRQELVALKGAPVAEEPEMLTFNAVDASRDALVDVMIDAGGRVAAVLYSGSESDAPPDIEPLRWRSEIDGRATEYGGPAAVQIVGEGVWYARFPNGVAAIGEGAVVKYYGIDRR